MTVPFKRVDAQWFAPRLPWMTSDPELREKRAPSPTRRLPFTTTLEAEQDCPSGTTTLSNVPVSDPAHKISAAWAGEAARSTFKPSSDPSTAIFMERSLNRG